jgi:glycosyltransferase involved in cell wall biosynthesis
MLSCNHRQYVADVLDSVQAQTFRDWQLIIVDNQSTDGSQALLSALAAKDPRKIRFLKLRRRVPIPTAANTGLALVNCPYIARLDSDDVWMPERLERQVNLLERPQNAELGVCGANTVLIDRQGTVIGRKAYPQTDDACRRSLWYRNPFCHSATLIRAECFRTQGPYDEDFALASDLELWFRLAEAYRLTNLGEFLVKYRVTGQNVTWQRHRALIYYTRLARRRASERCGYRLTLNQRLYDWGTWLAGFFPPALAFWLFHWCVVPCQLRFADRPWARRERAPALVPGKAVGTEMPHAL